MATDIDCGEEVRFGAYWRWEIPGLEVDLSDGSGCAKWAPSAAWRGLGELVAAGWELSEGLSVGGTEALCGKSAAGGAPLDSLVASDMSDCEWGTWCLSCCEVIRIRPIFRFDFFECAIIVGGLCIVHYKVTIAIMPTS